MRPHLTAERDLIRGKQLNHFIRVETQGPRGEWLNLSNLGGVDWVDSVTWRASIDQPVASGSLVIRKRIDGETLAPYMTGDVDGWGAFSPTVGPGRGLRIGVGIAPKGAASVAWRPVYIGKIDEIESGGLDDTMRIRHRDIGARLLDALFERDRVYGTDEGVPLQEVLQQMLDQTVGVGAVQLYVMHDPEFPIFIQRDDNGEPIPTVKRGSSLLTSMRDLVLQAGCDLRYRWLPDNSYRLTLYRPDREGLEVSASFDASEWQEVSELTLSDADVRNVIEVAWIDPATGQERVHREQDDDSIREYRGRRYMRLEGDATRHIGTQLTAQGMARAALADLSFPVASQAIRTLLWWPAELGDLYELQPDGVNYQSAIKAAVTAYEHTFANGTGWTTLALRGKPSGARREWIRRGGPNPLTI